MELQEGAMIDGSLVRVPQQRFTPDKPEQLATGMTPDWPPAKPRPQDVAASGTQKGTQSYSG